MQSAWLFRTWRQASNKGMRMTSEPGTGRNHISYENFGRVIKPLEEKDCRRFFAYLDEHLQASGTPGVPLFQPAPRTQSGYLKEKEASFIEGLHITVGSPKWRRAWVAV